MRADAQAGDNDIPPEVYIYGIIFAEQNKPNLLIMKCERFFLNNLGRELMTIVRYAGNQLNQLNQLNR